jgi:mRNA degradation ribonuclease J1/J2
MKVFIDTGLNCGFKTIPLDSNGIIEAEKIVSTNWHVLIEFTEAEDMAMERLQRMANNPDPQNHPSQSDMDLLDFYTKYE